MTSKLEDALVMIVQTLGVLQRHSPIREALGPLPRCPAVHCGERCVIEVRLKGIEGPCGIHCSGDIHFDFGEPDTI